MTILEHFQELKTRALYSIIFLLVSWGICYYYVEGLYDFLLAPLKNTIGNSGQHRIIYTHLAEAFFTYLELSLYVAILLSLPFFAVQFYIFLAPGLYRDEKLALVPFLILSPLLFLLGACFVYYFVFPMAWQFFLGFEKNAANSALPIVFEAKIGEYLKLVVQMIIAFGMVFQMPILLTLLAKIGIVTGVGLKKKRKIAVVAILVIAAFLTPPDVLSQVALAVPMYILYEISIFMCRFVEGT